MNQRFGCFLLIAGLQVACSGCKDEGTKFAVRNGHYYISSSVKAQEAAAVLAVLDSSDWFDKGGAVGIAKDPVAFQLRFIVRPEITDDLSWIHSFRQLAGKVSQTALSSAPVDIHLCDKDWTTLKVIAHSPPKPPLPIDITFRQAIGGGSLVAQFKNSSSKHLSVAVTVRNPTLNRHIDFALQVPPGRRVEHGWAEGWAYMSGDEVMVHHADYESVVGHVP